MSNYCNCPNCRTDNCPAALNEESLRSQLAEVQRQITAVRVAELEWAVGQLASVHSNPEYLLSDIINGVGQINQRIAQIKAEDGRKM